MAYQRKLITGLTPDQVKHRLIRWKILLGRYGKLNIDIMIFSDENLLRIEKKLISHIDMVYSASFDSINESLLTIKQFTKSATVMIFGVISKIGRFPFILLEPGIKINQHYYKTEILQKLIQKKH